MSARRQRLRLILLRAFAALSSPLRLRRVSPLSEAPRILLIRPDHIGDLLFATPAFRLLRNAFPDGHLTCMIGPWGRSVVRGNPGLDEIITCEFPGFTRQPKGSLLAPYGTLWQWVGRLRALRFDAAVVLRFDHWWGALLAYLAAIPRRVGFAIPECEPFLTQAVPYVSRRHEVQQNLALIEQLLRETGQLVPEGPQPLEFTVTEEDQEYVASYLAERGLTAAHDIIAIHPGAGSPVKLWRPEAWAELADALIGRWPVQVVLTGSGDELDLAWSVYARMHSEAIVAASDTTLGQLAALFQRCRLVVGPDCGPLHLAVATGTPTVHLYGPVDAAKFGPWGDPQKHRVLTSDWECIPCDRLDYPPTELASHPCVRDITVDAVLEAAEAQLVQR